MCSPRLESYSSRARSLQHLAFLVGPYGVRRWHYSPPADAASHARAGQSRSPGLDTSKRCMDHDGSMRQRKTLAGCLCSKTPHAPCFYATAYEAAIARQHSLVRTTLAAAQPASGRGPHIGCGAQMPLGDKTAGCVASAQRTRDITPRHTAGQPPAQRSGGDASRPRPGGLETGSPGDPWPPPPPAADGPPADGHSGCHAG